jgi:D-beta-D-heptose 7-phosphate kinase/D-beta-D-heptose 1-phosphate adenosyltransferase
MTPKLPRLIDRFRRLNVLVIGEAILDTYLEGTTDRLCREAPVPIVALSSRQDAPGGGANAAAGARALGAHVRFLSVVGDDRGGETIGRSLAERGINTGDLVRDSRRATLTKTRVVAGSQLLVRFDQGSTVAADPDTERELIDRLRRAFAGCEAVIVSDYGYGILTTRVIRELAALQARTPRVVVADSKDLAAYRRVGLTAVKPNFAEAAALIGAGQGLACGARAEAVVARGGRILEATGARIAAVTLDTEGAVVVERDRPPYRTYAEPAPHARAAGAGDTFLAALALALAAGADTPAAVDLASAAAAVVVGKDGTATCDARELADRVKGRGKVLSDRSDLAARLQEHRRRGRRVVFTNGCFDILHRGHVAYLSRAKALGDVLVVGVNSDASIGRLKRPGRPINALDDRLEVLAALGCVDHVAPFDEDTPCNLIRVVRPDVFVKGGDYTRERLPEAPLVESLGGAVHILPYMDDRSTTALIDRIRGAGSRAHRRAALAATNGHPKVREAPP